MKRILYITVALVALVACSKEQKEVSFAVEGMVVLKATVNINGQYSKVAPNDITKETVSFHWETGDKVTISNDTGSQEFTVSNINGNSADLVGTALPDMSSYTATYSTAVDGTVSYIEGSFKPIVSGTGSETSVTLDTFCPVIALNLKGSAVIKTIKYYVGDVLNTTLDCGISGIALSSTAKIVYFPVLSTATAATAKLEFNEGEVLILEKPIVSEVPGKIVTFPELFLYPYYENGNFYGLGIPITTTVESSTTTTIWAPVNCGYVPKTGDSGAALGYPYGKLYQWGRKYGQGYYKAGTGSTPTYEDATYPTLENGNLVDGPISTVPGSSDAEKFYKVNIDPYNWYCGTSPAPDVLWGASKTDYDPCPSGWRVPTEDELLKLVGRLGPPSVIGFVQKDGQRGRWFNGSTTPPQDGTSGVFLPAAGEIVDVAKSRDEIGEYWSSSVLDDEAQALSIFTNMTAIGSLSRSDGYSVRCVQEL